VEKVKPTIDALRLQIAEKDQEIERLSTELPDTQLFKTQLQEATTRIQEMRLEKDQLSAKLASVQDNLSSQQETNRQLMEELRELMEDLAEQKRERKRELAMQDHQTEGNELALTEEVNRLQAEVNRQASRIAQLESEKTGLDLSSDLHVLDAVLAKRQGVLDKIAGLKRQVLASVQ